MLLSCFCCRVACTRHTRCQRCAFCLRDAFLCVPSASLSRGHLLIAFLYFLCFLSCIWLYWLPIGTSPHSKTLKTGKQWPNQAKPSVSIWVQLTPVSVSGKMTASKSLPMTKVCTALAESQFGRVFVLECVHDAHGSVHVSVPCLCPFFPIHGLILIFSPSPFLSLCPFIPQVTAQRPRTWPSRTRSASLVTPPRTRSP